MVISSGARYQSLVIYHDVVEVPRYTRTRIRLRPGSRRKDVLFHNAVVEEVIPRRYADELFDKIIIKQVIGGKTFMSRKVQDPSRLTPLQMDTAILVPRTTLPGIISTPTNVVGETLAGLITATRTSYGLPLVDGTYRVEIVGDGSKFKVTNMDTGFESEETSPAADPITTLIPGVSLTIAALTGCVAGDYADIDVFGDTTYIVPGTVLGRLKDGTNKGKYEVAIDPNIEKYDILRICAGTLETDPDKRRIGSDGSSMMVNADTMTVSVYVFAQLSKSIVDGVNMTDKMREKIQGIVWY